MIIMKYTVNFSYGNSGTFKDIKTTRKAIMSSGFAKWSRVYIFSGSNPIGFVYTAIGNVYCYHDEKNNKTYILKKDGSLGEFMGRGVA